MGEVQALNQVMTNGEVNSTLTRNAAIYLELSDELGTLGPGRISDIIPIDGYPLTEISDLTNVKLVIQSGAITFDNR